MAWINIPDVGQPDPVVVSERTYKEYISVPGSSGTDNVQWFRYKKEVVSEYRGLNYASASSLVESLRSASTDAQLVAIGGGGYTVTKVTTLNLTY